MKKKLLIIFADGHLPYSPTTINLYDILSENFDVKIVALEPVDHMKKQESEKRNIEYINISKEMSLIGNRLTYFFLRLAIKLGLLKSLKTIDLAKRLKAFLFWKRIRKLKADEVIGVDFLGLWIAQIIFGKGHLLSLELNKDSIFHKIVDRKKIQSVIIQTEERYQYLFDNLNLNKFLVQNAPIYKPLISAPSFRKGLIFCGTALPEFGIYYCLDFISKYPEFTLTIRGGITTDVKKRIQNSYRYLIDEKRLICNESYIEQDKLSDYLSQFYIGFCFYDLKILKKYKYYDIFNYITAPSGKLFNYYAAGVPVVCSDIPGLISVKDFDAGVMINDYSPSSIKQAIDTISTNHARISANCFKAAEYFSFDKAIAPFQNYLLKGSASD